METQRSTHDTTLAALHAKMDALSADVAYLAKRQRATEELFAEMTPILKEVMSTTTTRLDDLEKRGYFAFGRELVRVGERIVEGFKPDDVRQLGDAVVGILETVRALTQPEVLAVAGEASEVLQHADQTEPLGLLGMVRATRDDDVQKGMAVMMEVMRHVGRAAQLVADKRQASPMEQKRAKLAAITGAKKKKVLGVERTAPAAAARAAASAPSAQPAAAGCGVPSSGTAPVAAVLDGVGFGADGHLADPSTWTPELALKIATAQGIPLDEPHWNVVTFVRGEFDQTKVSPNMRRITQAMGVTTKDLYALFPKAPARTIAKIAGVPKPAGCI